MEDLAFLSKFIVIGGALCMITHDVFSNDGEFHKSDKQTS